MAYEQTKISHDMKIIFNYGEVGGKRARPTPVSTWT